MLPLANFGTVNFSGSYTTGNGHSGSISDAAWSNDQIVMVTRQGPALPALPGRQRLLRRLEAQLRPSPDRPSPVSAEGLESAVKLSGPITLPT